MSKEAVAQLLEKALTDKQFEEQLKKDFDTAITGYDLTQEEIGAVRGGDSSKLAAMGVDERLSKWGAMFGSGI